MSGLETDIQWFIARDGKQHGPISDAELRKLVELGHLKATDLVWRQGFSDWRTAVSVFPTIAAPAPAAAPGPSSSASPQQAQPSSSAPAAHPYAGAPQGAQPAAHQPAPASQGNTAHQMAPHTQPGATEKPGQNPADQWRGGADPRPVDPSMATRPLGNPPLRTAGPFTAGGPAPQPAGPRPTTTDSRKPSEMTAPQRQPQPEARSGGGRRKALVAAGLLAMTGVGAWLASQYKDDILAHVQTTAADTSENGTVSANLLQPSGKDADSPTPTAAEAPAPAAAPGPTPDEIDRKLQNRGMWVAVKQQFPDWYQSRVAEVARLEADQKHETEISRYLIGEFVALRRENAQHALAASTARHKELASAFLANLKQLSLESGDGCYDFISKGESSSAIVERMGDPARSAEIEAQVVAIVGAIVEGRNQPATHSAPIKTDYDVLAGELGRLGWTQADMQLFANPKALAQAPHARVCAMLQDWFTAHLAIQDPSTQQRLLFETLKPVISG